MRLARGFTLVELLVVMAIVGLLASLVGPVGFQQYERARAIEEREQFYRLLEQARFDAFQKRQTLRFELEDQQLTIFRGRSDDAIAMHVFDRLSFPQQTLHVNNHGYWQPNEVHWFEADRQRQQRLNRAIVDTNLNNAAQLNLQLGGGT